MTSPFDALRSNFTPVLVSLMTNFPMITSSILISLTAIIPTKLRKYENQLDSSSSNCLKRKSVGMKVTYTSIITQNRCIISTPHDIMGGRKQQEGEINDRREYT